MKRLLLTLITGSALIVAPAWAEAVEGAAAPEGANITVANKVHDSAKPVTDWLLRLVMETPNGERSLHAHVPGADGGRTDLFVRPAWIFVPKVGNPSDLPSAIHNFYPDEEGRLWLTFVLRQSSSEIRRLAGQTLLLHHKDHLAKRSKSNPKDVVVERWPVVHLALRFFDNRNNRFLAQGETQSLVRANDDIEIRVPFTAESYAALLEASKHNEVRVIPYYTYQNRQTATLEKKTEVTSEVAAKIRSFVESEQATGRGPLFQGEVQQVISSCKLQLETIVVATSPELLAHVGDNSDYLGYLFEDQSKIFSQLNQEELRALSGYLQPLVDILVENTGISVSGLEASETENQDGTRHQNKQESGVRTGIKGETSGEYDTKVYGKYGGSASAFKEWFKTNTNLTESEKSERALEQFQKLTGVTLNKGKTQNEYVPHQIKIYRLREGASSTSVNDRSTFAVGIGVEHNYLEDSPTFLHWTTDNVTFRMDVEE